MYELKKIKLDEWIFLCLYSMVKCVIVYFEDYGFISVVCEIVVFIEELSNWYVWCFCDCFWLEGMDGEKVVVYDMFYEVLVILS